jgi:hypothetical protein
MLSGQVARPYTPTTGDETIGAMDLVVKVYEQVGYYKSTNADAAADTKSQILTHKKLLFFSLLQGKVSKAFGDMKVGDEMEMKVSSKNRALLL